MADKNDKNDGFPKLTDPSAAENALVGDDEVYGARYEPEPEVVQEDVQAQLPAEPAKPAETVPVNEFYLQMDQVVLDPSSPEAVQIPDAGRGELYDANSIYSAGGVEDRFGSDEGPTDSVVEAGDGPVSSDAKAQERQAKADKPA
jgi:hypothetical protein